MRESVRRCLSVLMVVAVVGAGTVALVNLDQGPDPVDQYGAVQDGEAVAPLVIYGAAAVVGTATGYAIGELTDSDGPVDPAEYEEAQQVHSELYSQALGQSEQQETLNQSFANYLEDTSTISKMEGKNALIRSLENGSTKTQAVADAREAVQDYYAVKQVNLARSWSAGVRSVERIANSAESEENLSVKDVIQQRTTDGDTNPVVGVSTANKSVKLLNGSDVEATELTLKLGNYDGGFWPTLLPNSADWSENGANRFQSVEVIPPESSSIDSNTAMLERGTYAERWAEIDQQAQAQADEVANFSQDVYDKWSAGLINSSDLVDPYLGAREYSPRGSTTTWSERSLSALGVLPPEEAADLRSMQIVDETTGITHEGTLMSDGNPTNASGFVVGETYNATKITGKQFVATSDGPEELTGRFTVANASGFEDGPSFGEGDVIKYSNPDYDTADLQEFKNLSEQIQRIRADLEARERKIEEEASDDGISIPNPFEGLDDMQKLLTIVAVAGAALLILRN